MIKRASRYILLAFIAVYSFAAQADQASGASDYISNIASKVIEIVKDKTISKEQKTDQLYAMLNKDFDLTWMSKFVIGKNYRSLSQDQKNQYQATYSKFFLYSYLPNLMKYSDESFHINKYYESDANSFTVETSILRTNGQPPISINYQVNYKDNQYKVIDIVVEGISAIMSQRSEFSSSVQQLGFDQFLLELKAKEKSLEDKSNNE